MATATTDAPRGLGAWATPGLFWLAVALIGTGVFFADGLDALFAAWSLPEYSHGPLIPVLSGLLLLRQLKDIPVEPGPKTDRWAGVAMILLAIGVATLGKLSSISDIVAYATIIWVGGLLLVSFGWNTGKHLWPPVLHLVYMLPLPGVLYYKMSTWLQLISSELGVAMLQVLSVPVHLDGNIIDLGVYKLHVAEACSGLRYLFPILSFSYIFAVLYRGPMWHKAVLLISAAPITVLMNAIRIAIGGFLVNHFGEGWLEGFSHFFEGWVIFISCILILFALAWVMLRFQRTRMGLVEALDLDTDGLWTQARRVRLIQPSAALMTSVAILVAALSIFQLVPERAQSSVPRDSFRHFPVQLDSWRASTHRALDPAVEQNLGADDYHQVTLSAPGRPDVGLFMAWYADQSQGGVHSPEICLPGAGWEIAWLERDDIAAQMGSETAFEINRAVIQRGEARMMVYYWFDQKGRRVAWDVAAKFWLLVDGIQSGRTDGALIRLTTVIDPSETDAMADARLRDALQSIDPHLTRFIPTQ